MPAIAGDLIDVSRLTPAVLPRTAKAVAGFQAYPAAPSINVYMGGRREALVPG